MQALYHTTNLKALRSILKDRQLKGEFVSFSVRPLFGGDISAPYGGGPQVALMFNPDSAFVSDLIEVEYDEDWYEQYPEEAAYIAGEGWREMYMFDEPEPYEEDYDTDEEYEDAVAEWEEASAEDYAAAQLDSFMHKSDENEWIANKTPVKFRLEDLQQLVIPPNIDPQMILDGLEDEGIELTIPVTQMIYPNDRN